MKNLLILLLMLTSFGSYARIIKLMNCDFNGGNLNVTNHQGKISLNSGNEKVALEKISIEDAKQGRMNNNIYMEVNFNSTNEDLKEEMLDSFEDIVENATVDVSEISTLRTAVSDGMQFITLMTKDASRRNVKVQVAGGVYAPGAAIVCENR